MSTKNHQVQKLIVIDREDVNNPLYPRLFYEWCEQLGHDPKTTDQLWLKVSKSEGL